MGKKEGLLEIWQNKSCQSNKANPTVQNAFFWHGIKCTAFNIWMAINHPEYGIYTHNKSQGVKANNWCYHNDYDTIL